MHLGESLKQPSGKFVRVQRLKDQTQGHSLKAMRVAFPDANTEICKNWWSVLRVPILRNIHSGSIFAPRYLNTPAGLMKVLVFAGALFWDPPSEHWPLTSKEWKSKWNLL